jgi:hypothetical protein
MDKLINNKKLLSERIFVSYDELTILNNNLYGIICIYKKSGLFNYKWKNRFFEINNNNLDHWNIKKKHKTCVRIKNINTYSLQILNETTQIFGIEMYCIILKKNKKIIKLYQEKLENLIIFMDFILNS